MVEGFRGSLPHRAAGRRPAGAAIAGAAQIGIGESTMEERVRDLLATRNPTVAPLAHLGEAHLRITAKAGSEAEAEALIAPLEAELRRRLGDAVYGVDEHPLEAAVIDLLAERQRTLAVAESVTGGLLGARLTNVPQ